ncbi:hypothetical protein [Psychrobacter urativorans]|uniref:DNA repair protein n=1 Tax=Psychrobacter urativorans TaxID=45610 RepID=A0A0M4U4A9_9GAMM|nr:hypothetical protein [Psychrobacter urativorans]ALF59469.1 hypothetical protein AOC03_04865 [Psychrobacter urativorans]
METISVIPTLISVLSVCIASLIYMNSREAVKNTKENLKQSQDKYLYELRLNALKATKEVEMTWQKAINDLYHEKDRIKNIGNNINLEIREMLDDLESGLLKPSLEHIVEMRKKLEEGFDDITEEEGKLIIRKMEIMSVELRHTQEQSIKKYQLLYDKMKDI